MSAWGFQDAHIVKGALTRVEVGVLPMGPQQSLADVVRIARTVDRSACRPTLGGRLHARYWLCPVGNEIYLLPPDVPVWSVSST